MTPEFIHEQLDHFDLLPDKEKEAQVDSLLLELLSLNGLSKLEMYFCLKEFYRHERKL